MTLVVIALWLALAAAVILCLLAIGKHGVLERQLEELEVERINLRNDLAFYTTRCGVLESALRELQDAPPDPPHGLLQYRRPDE